MFGLTALTLVGLASAILTIGVIALFLFIAGGLVACLW
jgi:hypothetical protein